MSSAALSFTTPNPGLALRHARPLHLEPRERGGWLTRHGFESVERRGGGVVYIEIRRFLATAAARATAAAAMSRAADASTLILDLRRHRGGDEAMGALLTSFLFDTEPLYADELLSEDVPLPPLAPESRCAAPRVEVWISGATNAAGIAFAENLERLGRAIVCRRPFAWR